MIRMTLAAAAALGAAVIAAPEATSQEPFIGEIRVFPYTFCPRFWEPAAGQTIAITSNTALYSLYGTTFGGNGTTTFNLPDLRGRSPMGIGQGPGLTFRQQGQMPGQERVTLTIAEMPAHNHAVLGSSAGGNASSINNAGFGNFTGVIDSYRSSGTLTQATRTDALSTAGGSQSHENRQPSLALRYCVAMQGLYPSRP
ncbi:MAG: tail fiber protein [Alphaproteobacteria bacterium]|nr:tail fiber protein [Alphaproteobacteria bacterium]